MGSYDKQLRVAQRDERRAAARGDELGGDIARWRQQSARANSASDGIEELNRTGEPVEWRIPEDGHGMPEPQPADSGKAGEASWIHEVRTADAQASGDQFGYWARLAQTQQTEGAHADDDGMDL